MLGGKVDVHPSGEWELAHTEVELSELGKRLFRTEEPTIRLHQMHQDHVSSVPSSETTDLLGPKDKIEVWGTTEHTYVQGVYLRDRLFTSQGHLGFDAKMVRKEVDQRVESGGIKDTRFAEERKDTAQLEHDGVIVAAAILRLFYGEDRDIE
jgi:GMP synthase-like glutamine amidotransferase